MRPERIRDLVFRMVYEHGSGRKGSSRRYYKLRRLFERAWRARYPRHEWEEPA